MVEPTRVYIKENESIEIHTELFVGQGYRLMCELGDIDLIIIKALKLKYDLCKKPSGQFKIEVTRLD